MESNPYSDMICAFLDGELDISNEESLFAALASAPDLRTEMREHLSIRSAVQSHTEAFMPPVESAIAVFGGVGLDYPAMSPPKERTQKSGMFWTTWGRIAVFSALFSLATWGATSYWYESILGEFISYGSGSAAAHSLPALRSASIAEVTALHTAAKPVKNTPYMAGNSANTLPANSFSLPHTVIPAIFYTENNDKLVRQGEASASTIPEARAILPATTAYSAPQRIAADIFRPADIYPQFWMQIRGIAMMHSSPASLPNVGIMPFDNVAVSGYHKLTSTFSVGAEIGREYYPLQYTGKSEGVDVIYRQIAPLLFGGLTAQYSMEPLENLGNIAPYFILSGGGTEIGQYARTTIGVYYPLSQSLGITLGGDLSGAFFQFQGRSFQSWKSGLTYGFAFQF